MALMPAAYHSRIYEPLQQVRHRRHVLAFFKKKLRGDSQDPVQICGTCAAHGVAAGLPPC